MRLPLIHAPVAAILAKSGGITLDPIAKPLAAVLAFFYGLVPNYGIAIVMLTVAMMIVLTPLTIKQTRSMLVMQKLQPQLKKLQEAHKNDRQALNEAVMALYKEHNASPLGGCLPMILPLPVFIALLRVLEGLSRQVTTNGIRASDPKYLSKATRMYIDIKKAGGHLDAFGMDLAKSARSVGGNFGNKLPYFVLLVLMVGTQFYQQRQLTSRNPQASGQPGQQAMMKFIPIFFGFISINFPAGVVIYWTVSNIIRIIQQWAMYRYDPKVKALVVQDIKEVEARTREIGAAKKSGRPRLRDMLGNAASAAAAKNSETKSPGGKPGGKGAAGPPNKAGGAKGTSGAKAGASPGKTPQGGAKPGNAKAGAGAGAGTGTGAGAGATKAGPQKANPAKPGGNRPVQPKGAGGGAANGGSTPKPATPAAGVGGRRRRPVAPGAAGGKPPGSATAGGGAGGDEGTDAVALGANKSNGPQGGDEGADAIPSGSGEAKLSGGNGAAGNGKGRTGGSSSRNVSSSRRRRRGR